ncbi:MAG: metal ABC transporter permease [Armatimonadota bacterium]
MAELWDYLTSPFVLRATVGIVLIAINASLTGAFAAFRSATFLVSGTAHAALAGAAFVLVVWGAAVGDVAPIIGGAVAAVVLALMAANGATRPGRRSAVDNTIGVGFAFFMALAVLLISMIPSAAARVWGILLGDLLLLTPSDLWLLGGMTALLIVAFGVWWRPFLFITFDSEGAQAFGLRAGLYNHLLFALIGLSTAVLLKGVGAIVVFAMLAAPAATAMLFAASVPRTMLFAFLIALLSGLVALVISNYIQFSVSAMAALLASGSYFVGRGIVWARQAAEDGARKT